MHVCVYMCVCFHPTHSTRVRCNTKSIFEQCNHHHHHDGRLARISLTLSLHVSLSFIAFGRSSGLHPVSSHSCCINVRAGRPAFEQCKGGLNSEFSFS